MVNFGDEIIATTFSILMDPLSVNFYHALKSIVFHIRVSWSQHEDRYSLDRITIYKRDSLFWLLSFF